ncbi:MAG: lipocalin [Legionellales bacterium]|nr:lipocalin [Legionellales bacterium]|tara:strand:+ start:6518 stop:7042 length:525 start_codon:yes stop_codon:yes gene_type:complete
MDLKKNIVITFFIVSIIACTTTPKGVRPISNFDINKYLGIWHEIARLDHSFERDLVEVYAEYSLREDGGITVINRGKNPSNAKWKEAIGKAYFVNNENIGSLKVSFFWPFYGGYNIVKLDNDYTMALVIGPTLKYAWILSRSTNPQVDLCDEYFAEAKKIGIADEKWIKIRDCI